MTSSGGVSLLDPATVLVQFGVQPGMRVADFGCGSGHFTILLAHAVGPEGRVTAFDVQEEPLDTVRGKVKAAGLANVEAVRADLEVAGSTGLSDGSQDFVLVANILFQSQRKVDMLREAHRVLKSSGRLAVVEWAKGAGGMGPPDELRSDQASIEHLLQTTGFVVDQLVPAGGFHMVLLAHRQES